MERTERTERIRLAFKEQGIKTIRDRQNKAKMADDEVLRNVEEDRLTGRTASGPLRSKRRDKQSSQAEASK